MPDRNPPSPHPWALRKVFSYSTALVTTQLLMAGYTLLLIWWLAPEDFGILSANYAAVSMLAFLVNWGFNEWLVKAVPTADHPRVLTGSLMRFRGLVGVAWGASLWLLLPLIQPEIYLRGLLAVILLDVWLDTGNNLLIADLVGNERVKAASVLLVISRGLRLLGLGALLWAGSHELIFISLVRLGCTALVFATGWLLTRPEPAHPARLDLRQVFRVSYAFNAYEVLNQVYTQIDINLLTWLNGDARLIGNYAFVSNVLNMIVTIPLGIYNLILPGSIRSQRAEPARFGRRMLQTVAGFALLGLALWAGIHLLGLERVTDLFGAQYREGINLLILVSPALFLRSLNQANSVYLLTMGLEMKRLLPQLMVVLIKALLGVVVVLRWQALGLVWWTIVTDGLLLAGFSWLSLRHSLRTTRQAGP